MSLIVRYLYKGEREEELNRMRWQFPLLVGFGIACKLSFAPFFLIPLILLVKNGRDLWILIRNTFLSTLLFAYPLFTNYKESFKWIKNMAEHSGMHGSGEENVIDWSQIPLNAKALWLDFPAFWVLASLNVLFLAYLYLKPTDSEFHKRLRRSLLATLICLIGLVLLVLKHFALHYFMPFYALTALWLLFPYIFLLQKKATTNQWQSITAFSLIAALYFSTLWDGKMAIDSQQSTAIKRAKEAEAIKKLIKEEEAALIVDAPFWGTPFPAYAHAFGFMHSYRRKTYFKEALRKEFPNFYLHVGWTNKFNHWDRFVGLDVIFNKSKQVYVYTGPNTKGLSVMKQRLQAYEVNGKQVEEKTLWQSQDGAKLIKWERKP
jgi:hypothetical protein